jgi:hypothetical protein
MGRHDFGHRGEGEKPDHLPGRFPGGGHEHERRPAGLAQNNFQNYASGAFMGAWDFEWSPFTDCPAYDPQNIGQNFGCAHPMKRLPHEIR